MTEALSGLGRISNERPNLEAALDEKRANACADEASSASNDYGFFAICAYGVRLLRDCNSFVGIESWRGELAVGMSHRARAIIAFAAGSDPFSRSRARKEERNQSSAGGVHIPVHRW
jgi:hypothetical protein